MLARHPFVVVAVALAVAWYFLVGAVDRALINRQLTSVSIVCLDEYLPRGTIHNSEGQPRPPRGEYTFFPLGLDCTFTMNNGTTQSSFHPRYPQIVLGTFPLAGLVVGVTVASLRKRPTTVRSD